MALQGDKAQVCPILDLCHTFDGEIRQLHLYMLTGKQTFKLTDTIP